ncbi:hypothetical protein [Leisingera sp. JC1]|uniref:hypothetical protein n=1 Tax=Leisingera sp. JC1 TaxID=1855282 RepID=UPI000802C13D|nr:hypothetical protein [Leisingera sp. JC1]OBY26505.1 hypothetical protein A9D60_04470 [Leisingera sp. JC1]
MLAVRANPLPERHSHLPGKDGQLNKLPFSMWQSGIDAFQKEKAPVKPGLFKTQLKTAISREYA